MKETEQAQISMKSQLHITDRLKREMKYGINGDTSVSKTSISDLARLNSTVNDFITQSEEYEEEDKDLLKEIFRDGNQLIFQFDSILRRVQFLENVMESSKISLNAKLTSEEKA